MNKWWKNGVAFSCTQCGKCCNARDDVAYVYVSQHERRLLAKEFKMSVATFTRHYALRENDGKFFLRFIDGHCIFLHDNKCIVHHVKPTQCRTWPFWEEVMASKEVYQNQVLDFCPGSNVDTPIISTNEIAKQIKETDNAFFEV
jgi:hypothetical protein